MTRISLFAAAAAALCLSQIADAQAQPAPRLIVNQLSGKCLDVPGISNLTPGTPLQLWDCEVSGVEPNGKRSDQFWYADLQGPIRNALSGLCMDISGTHPGAQITVAVCNPANPAQIWTLQPDGFIRNVATGKCIDVVGYPGVVTGTPLQLFDCEVGHPQTDQRWR